MSKISDYVAQQNQYNDQLEASIDNIVADVKFLNDTIAKLQASAGEVTPEDQALIDAAQARTKAIVDKVNALDAMTPPAAPPVG